MQISMQRSKKETTKKQTVILHVQSECQAVAMPYVPQAVGAGK
jgi:hypothetical protein